MRVGFNQLSRESLGKVHSREPLPSKQGVRSARRKGWNATVVHYYLPLGCERIMS